MLERVKSFPGVVGHIIIDNNSNVVHTSLEREEAISLAAVAIKLIEDGKEAIQELGDMDADFIRLRSKKRDILIVPGSIYSFAMS